MKSAVPASIGGNKKSTSALTKDLESKEAAVEKLKLEVKELREANKDTLQTCHAAERQVKVLTAASKESDKVRCPGRVVVPCQTIPLTHLNPTALHAVHSV